MMPQERFDAVAVPTAMLGLVLLAVAVTQATPEASPSPQQVLGLIRAQFRSHRPPTPFVTYTLVRAQMATNGYPDFVDSYTKHVWVRSSDRAALSRIVWRDEARGPLTFERPGFNGNYDPGPPTADLFESAPLRSRPLGAARTPEPGSPPLPVIGGVRTALEPDYRVDSLAVEGDRLHLVVTPLRDLERNRLREIFCDAKTYELRRLVVADRLFARQGGVNRVFPLTYTIAMGVVQGVPVVTAMHGVVGGGYNDDGKEVDYTFTDIAFPASLPDWYFEPAAYGRHVSDAGPL